jgi:hypothetical protein
MNYEQWLDSIRALGFIPLPDEEIRPGDSYCAERNTGLKLLTCKEHNHTQGFITPTENAYCYDTHECIKVKLP